MYQNLEVDHIFKIVDDDADAINKIRTYVTALSVVVFFFKRRIYTPYIATLRKS